MGSKNGTVERRLQVLLPVGQREALEAACEREGLFISRTLYRLAAAWLAADAPATFQLVAPDGAVTVDIRTGGVEPVRRAG